MILIQDSIIDFRSSNKISQHSKNKSFYTKTLSYFENDIFNDKVLKELQTWDSQRVDMNYIVQCKCFVVDRNSNFFIATNRNFIYFCTQSTTITENVKTIMIDECR